MKYEKSTPSSKKTATRTVGGTAKKRRPSSAGRAPRRIPNRTYTVDLGGIPVTVTRKEMKTMRLRVQRSDLSVRLSVPHGVTEERVMLFLSSREAWIRETLASLGERTGCSERRYEDGDPLDLFGVRYTVSLVEGDTRYALFFPEDPAAGGTVLFRVPEGSTAEKRERFVRDFYREKLSELLDVLFPKWEAVTGLVPASRDIRYMKSRWGSCNTGTRHIRMNLRLAEHLPIYTEYVVLHELCHLKVPNHGKDFYALLDGYMPDWRQIRARLNGK